MKIGVFGDSFAENFSKNFPNRSATMWWEYLRDQFGHEVECFGERASDLLYSAKLINKHAPSYDLAIWCVTAPGRYTVKKGPNFLHLSGSKQLQERYRKQVDQFDVLENAYKMYMAHLFDEADDVFVCNALVNYVIGLHTNIMIIPCFHDPLFSDSSTEKFTLSGVSKLETDYYFPNTPLYKIHSKYVDLRAGHLTDINHQNLARCINSSLSPGIFQTEYSKFTVPTVSISNSFKYDIQSHQKTQG